MILDFPEFNNVKYNLLESLSLNKLHHGIIFSGIKGIGKSLFVQDLCKEITKNTSQLVNNPDILLVTRGLNQKKELRKEITVNETKKINDFINLTSSQSKYRIIIIDAIDDLNKNSSNAILKNLEEPPANTFFFLINHNEAKILDTIRSRCNLIKIKTPSYEEFCNIMTRNNIEIEPSEMGLLYEISGGSISDAIKSFDNNSFKNYQNIVSLACGNSDNLSVMDFASNLVKSDLDLMMCEQLTNLFFSRVLMKSQNNLKDELFPGEEFSLSLYLKENNTSKIFDKYDEIKDIISKTNWLNLDKKQSLINIFNNL